VLIGNIVYIVLNLIEYGIKLRRTAVIANNNDISSLLQFPDQSRKFNIRIVYWQQDGCLHLNASNIIFLII
jgi:hypothetical protein